MTNTKQDERTPGRGGYSMNYDNAPTDPHHGGKIFEPMNDVPNQNWWMIPTLGARDSDSGTYVIECSDGIIATLTDGTKASLIVKAVNAYTSTDALRSALAPFALLADEFRDVVPDDFKIGLFTTSLHEPTVGDLRRARAALSSSPAPSTEGLREALMLAEKADRIHSKCQECEDGAQAPEACEHCFPSADDARVARRNVLKALGVKMRDVDKAQSCGCSQEDVHDYGPCDENCRAVSGSPSPSTEGLREALANLVNAKALSGVRSLVAGWNGEDKPERYERHPSRMGARIETTCGRIYELDELLTAARTALAGVTAPANAEPDNGGANGVA